MSALTFLHSSTDASAYISAYARFLCSFTAFFERVKMLPPLL